MNYKIKDLTESDLQVIFQGLGKLTLESCINTFAKLNQQFSEQKLAQQQRQHDAAADAIDRPAGAPAPQP